MTTFVKGTKLHRFHVRRSHVLPDRTWTVFDDERGEVAFYEGKRAYFPTRQEAMAAKLRLNKGPC